MSDSQTWYIYVDHEDDPLTPDVFIVNASWPQAEDGFLYLKDHGQIKAAFPVEKVRACILGTGKYDNSLADKH